ncbi:TetR/AcrR family transcriptional regulator [Aminobacter sp. NyZ550]|uniref:TetR/AcrR family transcriptional regulator n=1 Tax=Aminobacter sp. NyZ550 TaxID=2979870 RepID=UPI0021D5749F|nr:TetR/AcrR family transcriptional regulator [Aminobacter sp. NyZ550]WAX97583.1 TetR/AcrR family transcriptional regulator [Aminobacter sp. NyZ550]
MFILAALCYLDGNGGPSTLAGNKMALDRNETKERVLGIAERLLNEGGAAKLQARTIASEAGIAVGSIYNLFGDLTGILRAVNTRLLERLDTVGNQVLGDLERQGVTDPVRLLLALAGIYQRFVVENPGSWQSLLATGLAGEPSDETRAYEERLSSSFLLIADILEKSGLITDPRLRGTAAHALWSSVHGIVTVGYATDAIEGRRGDVSEQITLLVTTFVAGLRQRV